MEGVRTGSDTSDTTSDSSDSGSWFVLSVHLQYPADSLQLTRLTEQTQMSLNPQQLRKYGIPFLFVREVWLQLINFSLQKCLSMID